MEDPAGRAKLEAEWLCPQLLFGAYCAGATLSALASVSREAREVLSRSDSGHHLAVAMFGATVDAYVQ